MTTTHTPTLSPRLQAAVIDLSLRSAHEDEIWKRYELAKATIRGLAQDDQEYQVAVQLYTELTGI